MNNSKQAEQRFSETIEMMRFPLIFLVVIAHMVPFETPKVELSTDIDSIYTLVSEMISHNLARLSVRCYFLISGYFFFKGLSQSWDWNTFIVKLKKKGRTLFVPYLIWNAVLIVAVVVKYHTFICLGLGVDEGWAFIKETSFYDWFWGMPINFPLWYMRDLIVMVLLSPLFYFLFLYTKAYGLLVIGCLYLLVLESSVTGFSTTAFFFFGAGAYLAMNRKDVILLFGEFKKSIAILSVIMLAVATAYNGTLYHEYILRIFIVLGVVSTLNLFDYLRKFEKLKKILFALAPTTFFIYVAHEIYIINWLKGALARFSDSAWNKLLGYFIVPCICIGVCIGLYYLLKKLMPRFMTIALGGRLVSNVKNVNK